MGALQTENLSGCAGTRHHIVVDCGLDIRLVTCLFSRSKKITDVQLWYHSCCQLAGLSIFSPWAVPRSFVHLERSGAANGEGPSEILQGCYRFNRWNRLNHSAREAHRASFGSWRRFWWLEVVGVSLLRLKRIHSVGIPSQIKQ